MTDRIAWYQVASHSKEVLPEGGRLHLRVQFRYITLFRRNNVCSAIDSICHHAGGPLTLGEVEDMEDLGLTVVLCPWHKYRVDIVTGSKVYQSVEVIDGKPQVMGWRIGRMVQRVHLVREDDDDTLYVGVELGEPVGSCPSDADTCNSNCARGHILHKDFF